MNLREEKPGAVTAGAREKETGFVLAGGRSSRMGRDKALAMFGGRPLIEIALEMLREAGLNAAIAGGRSGFERFCLGGRGYWSRI